MKEEQLNSGTHRRGFLGMLASGVAAIGITAIASPFKLNAQQKAAPSQMTKSEADIWFNKLKGTHRVVYDSPRPHEIFPFAWPKVFIMSNESTGSPASDCGVVVVLRHSSICFAFNDAMWEKYKLAEMCKVGELGGAFQAADAATATQKRNPFFNTQPGDFKIPGIGPVPIGITDLQKDGVMFCVCNAAINVYANVVAGKMNTTADVIIKEWKENLIPGIQIVPSGVWALGRAQEHKCAYIFAG